MRLNELRHLSSIRGGDFRDLPGAVSRGYATIQIYGAILDALLDARRFLQVRLHAIESMRARGSEVRITAVPGRLALESVAEILEADQMVMRVVASATPSIDEPSEIELKPPQGCTWEDLKSAGESLDQRLLADDKIRSFQSAQRAELDIIRELERKHPRALCVDDQVGFCAFVRDLFHSQIDDRIDVRDAGDADRAVREFEEFAPDIVVLDLAIPQRANDPAGARQEVGRAVLQALRGRSEILLVSASAPDEAARVLGSVPYLQKSTDGFWSSLTQKAKETLGCPLA